MKISENMKVLRFVEGVFVMLLLVIIGVLVGTYNANAQTPPSMTFGASVTNANGSLTTTLTWSTTPAAANCVASGSPSWTGTKAGAGSFALPTITMSGTYNLSLSCTWPGDTTAILSWTAPTANTDGTPLTKCLSQTTATSCLRSFNISHGVASGVLPDVIAVNDRNATSYTWTGLAAGTHYFAMTAVNGLGVESALTPEVSKVIAPVTQSSAVTLTVNPKPSPPGGLTVQ